MTLGSLVSEAFCVSYLSEGKKEKSLINTHFYRIQLEEKRGININWFQFIQVGQGFVVRVKNGGKM